MDEPTEPLDEILNLAEAVALARVKAFNAANRGDADAVLRHVDQAQAVRLAIAVKVEDVRAAGVAEGRRQRDADVERLQVLLDHAEQYARDLQDNGDVDEREEEWGLRYKLNGKQQEPGDGGHVFDSREEAEQHITAWRGFYPNLTYTDVEFMRRETLTTAWVSAGRQADRD